MMTTTLTFATLLFFPAMMAFAASSDLFTMTISNRLSIGLVAGFVALAFAAGVEPQVIGIHLLCGFACLAFTFTLFAFGWIGGGDAKLAAATAVWLGFAHMADYGAIASILGGVLTLGIIQMRGMTMPPWLAHSEWFARLNDPGNGVPYGIALAAAGLLLYPDTQLFESVARM